jgi:hypothetical protein
MLNESEGITVSCVRKLTCKKPHPHHNSNPNPNPNPSPHPTLHPKPNNPNSSRSLFWCTPVVTICEPLLTTSLTTETRLIVLCLCIVSTAPPTRQDQTINYLTGRTRQNPYYSAPLRLNLSHALRMLTPSNVFPWTISPLIQRTNLSLPAPFVSAYTQSPPQLPAVVSSSPPLIADTGSTRILLQFSNSPPYAPFSPLKLPTCVFHFA